MKCTHCAALATALSALENENDNAMKITQTMDGYKTNTKVMAIPLRSDVKNWITFWGKHISVVVSALMCCWPIIGGECIGSEFTSVKPISFSRSRSREMQLIKTFQITIN